jgi:hypothetical protein
VNPVWSSVATIPTRPRSRRWTSPAPWRRARDTTSSTRPSSPTPLCSWASASRASPRAAGAPPQHSSPRDRDRDDRVRDTRHARARILPCPHRDLHVPPRTLHPEGERHGVLILVRNMSDARFIFQSQACYATIPRGRPK